MLEHVEAVELPLLDPGARRQLRNQNLEQPAVAHQPEPYRGPRRLEQALQLVADPLGGYLADRVQGGGNAGEGPLFDVEVELSREAAGPQGSQAVLEEALEGIAYGPNDPGLEIPAPGVGVQDTFFGQVIGYGVDGEVPAFQVLLDRRCEHDSVGSASVPILLVDPKGGNFEADTPKQNGHGPVLDPGGNDPAETTLNLLRQGVSGDVEVRDSPAQQHVPNRSADEVALETGSPETRGKVLDDPGNP